jgi:hypothetical protein
MVKPDILKTIQTQGVKLRQSGKSWWALCPFHEEKKPSFSVNPQKQLWHCFGCNKGGDVIQFIMELKSFSFKKACNYLHLKKSRPVVSPEVLAKKQAVESFRTWCKDKENELCQELQTLNHAAFSIEKDEDFEKIAPMFSEITDLNYYLDILQGVDDELKFNLYKEEKGKIV